MPVVQLPDGSVVDFPEGTSEKEMNTALAGWKNTATQQQTAESGFWWKVPAYLGSKVVAGTEGLLGLPGSLMSAANEGMGRAYNTLMPWGIPSGTPEAARFNQQSVDQSSLLPTSKLQAGTNAFGITNNPTLETGRSLPVRLAGGAAEALPAAALSIATGGAAAPALTTAGVSGAAAELAHEYDPDSILAPIMAGMLGGYGVGAVDRMVGNFGKVKTARKALDAADSALEDFKDKLPTARFDVGQAFDKAKKLAVDNYTAFKQAAIAERDAVADGVKNTVTGIASKLSPVTDLQGAGEKLQDAARNWLGKVMPDKHEALWKPIDDNMPGTATVDITPIVGAADRLAKSAGSLQNVAESFQPSGIKTPAQRLKASIENLQDPATPLVNKPWKDVSSLRSIIGEAMGNQKVVNDIGRDNLANLYAVTTQTMRKTAGDNGLLEAFDAANSGSKKLFDTAEGTMSKVVSGKNPDPALDQRPGDVAANLLRVGGRNSGDLKILRDELGPELDHLGAVALNSGAWSKLHPGSKEALLPDAGARGAVDLALQQKSDADGALAQALDTGKKTHQNNLDIADLARKQGNLQLTNSMRSLVKTKGEAKENLSSMTEDRTAGLQHGIGGLFGTAAGGELGILGLNALGLPGSDIVHGAIGSTIGMMAPAVARGFRRGVKTAVNDPSSLKYPALGAAAGSSWQPQIPEDSKRNPFIGQ